MPILWESSQPIEIFYCYAHPDEAWRDMLEKHLRILKRQGYIVSWYDRMISAGTEWAREIDAHINTAQIILLLISSDFLDSDYCFDVEMTRALERHRSGDAVIIPIIIRPVYWAEAPFSHLQVLPRDGLAVTKWPDRDEAFENITQGIVNVVKDLLSRSVHAIHEREHLKNEAAEWSAFVALTKNRNWHFTGQWADETIYVIARRHFFFLALAGLPLVGSFVFLLTAIVTFSLLHVSLLGIIIFSACLLLVSIFLFISTIYRWYRNFYIITNRRVIHVYGVFRPTREEILLDDIEQIGIDINSSVASRLEYGNVHLYLSNQHLFLMKNVPAPRKLKDVLKTLCFSDKQRVQRTQEDEVS